MSEVKVAERPLLVLVACEETQKVTTFARALGHEAYSCDIVLPSGEHPEWHFHCDVQKILKAPWDVLIGFPPCTHLAVSGAAWFEKKRKDGRQDRAIEFVRMLADADIPKIALENPVGVLSTRWRPPDQIIQPWQFGHAETKLTCLWLKNLPPLVPSAIVEGRKCRVHGISGEFRSARRSETYDGIAKAMVEQWLGRVPDDRRSTKTMCPFDPMPTHTCSSIVIPKGTPPATALASAFVALPPLRQYEIAKELGIQKKFDNHREKNARVRRFLTRAIEANKLAELWTLVFGEGTPNPYMKGQG